MIFLWFVLHFISTLPYTGILADTPLSEKKKLQSGPSPAFSAVASCRWCSARQGLPGLQRGGAWEREGRGTPTQVGVRVHGDRKQARRRQWRRWSSGRRRCRRRRAQGRGTSCLRAPREHEEAPGVALVHGLPLGWPVRGEPELAGGGAEGEWQRGWVWARFSARGA